jgi:hypothetical protein
MFGWEVLLRVRLQPVQIALGASTAKVMRQSSRPHMHDCDILKQTSITVAYSSSCTGGKNAWNSLGISWNSGGSYPVIQDSISFLFMCLCFNIK